MNISKFDYLLPHELIAQKPANPRDTSKLLLLDRNTGEIKHTIFHNITNYFNKNDVLVFNKSKVFPARLFGQKKTKGKVEILILRFLGDSTCEAITKPGLFLHDKIKVEDLEGEVIQRNGYITHIGFSVPEDELKRKITVYGHTPIPPYIGKTDMSEKDLREKYQTVYAKQIGSSAAPTAGLHFTKELLKKIAREKIRSEYVTLHVGLGTFASVKEKIVEKHKIHEEYFEVDAKTLKKLNQAKKDGKRIIAVGTTTTRVLETLASNKLSQLEIRNLSGSTNLFIYPPYKFKFVDGLITNFHLPKSTLLMLASAFVSYPNTSHKFVDFGSSSLEQAYSAAIEKQYRFFSFGDAMFIQTAPKPWTF